MDKQAETRAKTHYTDVGGTPHPLALMPRAQAIEAIQELQARYLNLAERFLAQGGRDTILSEQALDRRFVLDKPACTIVDTHTGKRVSFSPSQFVVVDILIRHFGGVVSHEAIALAMDDYRIARRFKEDVDTVNLLKVQLCHIRTRLRRAEFPLQIDTRWSLGYIARTLEEEV